MFKGHMPMSYETAEINPENYSRRNKGVATIKYREKLQV